MCALGLLWGVLKAVKLRKINFPLGSYITNLADIRDHCKRHSRSRQSKRMLKERILPGDREYKTHPRVKEHGFKEETLAEGLRKIKFLRIKANFLLFHTLWKFLKATGFCKIK